MFQHCTNPTPTPSALSLLHLKPLYEYMAVCTSISGIHVYSSIVLSVRALLHTFCSLLPHNSYPHSTIASTSETTVRVYGRLYIYFWNTCLLINSPVSRRTSTHVLLSLPHNSYPHSTIASTSETTSTPSNYFYTRSVLAYHTTPTPTALSLLHLKPLYEYMAVCTSIPGIHVYSSIVLSVRAF
ncbi:hypothetical protein J6590_073185 [Homalodisca vitripennis]|nr:hypothetical protein J6590_073185 [Homalodisca vitripennis]